MWSGTIVTDDLRMLFTEACIKRVLAKVSQQLDPPALGHILTEMHHAVKVVDVGGFGLLVAIFIHCNYINCYVGHTHTRQVNDCIIVSGF